ncbi:MAG: hypothetical protein R3324_21735, partial [Halobacteriales archaeon]|nr:hypothetical protein [Halobacteriales archaeon]
TATVTEGVNGSGIGQSQGQVQGSSPYAIAGWPFLNVVRVVWDVGLGGEVDVDFHLVVVCP